MSNCKTHSCWESNDDKSMSNTKTAHVLVWTYWGHKGSATFLTNLQACCRDIKRREWWVVCPRLLKDSGAERVMRWRFIVDSTECVSLYSPPSTLFLGLREDRVFQHAVKKYISRSVLPYRSKSGSNHCHFVRTRLSRQNWYGSMEGTRQKKPLTTLWVVSVVVMWISDCWKLYYYVRCM